MRVDTKLLEIMPKLQILLDKGNVTFIMIINGRDLIRLLNFLLAATLDFMTSLQFASVVGKLRFFCFKH